MIAASEQPQGTDLCLHFGQLQSVFRRDYLPAAFRVLLSLPLVSESGPRRVFDE